MPIEKMSLILALGICVGIMPVFGISTWLLLLLAIIFKLNIAAIQLVNYATVILKYILFVPFLKMGQFLFSTSDSNIRILDIVKHYREDFIGTFHTFWQMNLAGLMVWLVISIPLGIWIYYKSQPLLERQRQKLALAIA